MSTLKDLNQHLFNQLARLESADKDSLEGEVKRAQTMAQVGAQIIDAHKVQLEAVKLVAELDILPDLKDGVLRLFR